MKWTGRVVGIGEIFKKIRRKIRREETSGNIYRCTFFYLSPMAFYSPLRTYVFLNGLLDPIDIW